MSSPPLFDLADAYADRHAGQDACLAAAESGYRNHRALAEIAVDILARNARPFCADDVHRLLAHELPDGYNRNVVSSVMGQYAHRGDIVEDVTLRPVASRNRSRRASRNRWWLGAVHARRQSA